jgi:glycosyltransferase involved in cell wall biosynthesis
LAAELGIAERTRFTGWLDETMHYVAASDVFVMPSRHEPLGNVILESWHAGIPTVTTRSEGPIWFVADGKDALMCAIDDVDGMAAAIVRIRDDPVLAHSLVENGRAKLAAAFTKERVTGSPCRRRRCAPCTSPSNASRR